MTTFDTLKAADIASLHALWDKAFPGSPVIALHTLDQRNASRTFVAREGDEVLAALYWLPRPVRGDGQVHRAGCVSSVASDPRARGRGLVKHLLGLATAAMAAENCRFSLLFTETPGVYEGSGWSTFARPHLKGEFTSGTLPPGWTVTTGSLGDWPVLDRLHTRHNADRPLTVVRTPQDWADRVPIWYGHDQVLLLEEHGTPLAYAVVDWRDGDVVEIALAEDRAAAPLFTALTTEARARDVREGHLRAPLDPAVRAALPALFRTAEQADDRTGMIRPVLGDARLVEDPRAVYWPADYF